MSLSFDHIHLISESPEEAAAWYERILGGKIVADYELRGAPQINVQLGGMQVIIRGRRPGESPVSTRPMRDFADYSSHDEWGTDHFGYTYHGDLKAFCEEIRRKGATLAVEPWEFSPGSLICYVAAPDGVSIELVQARS
ncbi:MAG: VOC family protein [Gammaproteobacteria bacterium]|nr:VOC family protein [Gammaproteobacteria bacterium]MCY4015217.1 VOC family protein [Gammaproteobacteria bacterium]